METQYFLPVARTEFFNTNFINFRLKLLFDLQLQFSNRKVLRRAISTWGFLAFFCALANAQFISNFKVAASCFSHNPPELNLQQGRQYTYNVTLRHVHATIVAVDNQ
jgi:hypothetical protein